MKHAHPSTVMPRLVLALPLLALAACQTGPNVSLDGLEDGAVLNAAAFDSLAATMVVPKGENATFLLDDRPVLAFNRGDGRFELRLDSLDDGEHTLRAVDHTQRGPRWRFTLDRTPPSIRPDTVVATGARGPFTVRGAVSGADSLTATTPDGTRLAVERTDSTFAVTVPDAKARRILLTATDEAGNRATRAVALAVGPMRGVHVTALGWTARSLREPILRLVREGNINTIQLDLKDEAGEIGYTSAVPLAARIGANKNRYDARAVLDSLHAMGVRVVGRLVVFRDPILGRWAWTNGRRDWLVQTSGGQPFGGKYGAFAFTNPYADSVSAYNRALAEEAARLGFDDVLLDYIRRPEGALSTMHFAGMPKGDSVQAGITRFVCQSAEAVHALGAGYGVSVFGIAASRPWAVAQDIPALARCVDLIAPMVYPSHWGPGEYGVSHPNAMPYDITHRSLLDFRAQVAGTDAAVVPWLQDFSLGVPYDAAKVRAQIQAAADAGMPSFLLWNAGARYTAAALE